MDRYLYHLPIHAEIAELARGQTTYIEIQETDLVDWVLTRPATESRLRCRSCWCVNNWFEDEEQRTYELQAIQATHPALSSPLWSRDHSCRN